MLTMMVAVDGSEHALQAVRHAIWLVNEGLRAHIVLAHVQESTSLVEIAMAGPVGAADASVDAGKALIGPAVKLLRDAGVAHEVEVRIGDVPPTLLDIAESHEAAMILIGSTDEGALSRIFLGSIGNKLVSNSSVPVTIVKVPALDD